MSQFAQTIREWQQRNNISDFEFELTMQTVSPVTVERLREILAGARPTFDELAFIGIPLTKPGCEGYTLDELGEIRDRG